MVSSVSHEKRLASCRSKLYEPETGRCYSGISQNLFDRHLTVAYIFANRAPSSGTMLVDSADGSRYQVKNVINLQEGKKISAYELVLNNI